MKRSRTSSSDADLDFARMLEQLCRERGLDQSVLITAIEDALQSAAQRFASASEKLRARFDPAKGAFAVFALRRVVDDTAPASPAEIRLTEALALNPGAKVGDWVEIPKNIDAFGRIAAQTARQVIATRMREIEAESVYQDYRTRLHQVFLGVVKRQEGHDIVVDLGSVEAVLPRKEQSPIEHHEVGERLRAVLVSVQKRGHEVEIVLSRAEASFLTKLLECEVPEIRDQLVSIKGVVREAGDRAKVAVTSSGRSIDPVGACIGVRGTRIQAIIREMRGEKIDVVEWSDDPRVFIANALSPARVRDVTVVSRSDKLANVTVDEKQLSLAIGKKGQNVRLASRLTGWRIDIKPEGGRRGHAV